jgi:hypothetical protein
MGLERNFRKLRTNASDLLPEPTRLHQFEASRQKLEWLRCLSIWMAGRPDSD